jgi:hypothetical protein
MCTAAAFDAGSELVEDEQAVPTALTKPIHARAVSGFAT